jgi:phosphate transport system substrate-binding protein
MPRHQFGTFLAVTLLTWLPAIAAAQPVLRLDGSTGAMPLVEVLAKAHATRTPGLVIEIGKGLGTKARIDALRESKIDIAVASHGLNIDEIRSQGMAVHEIARAAVVFGVHAGVSVTTLTQAQICAIYAGNTTNWQALGGPDRPIAARTRPDSEVDAEVARNGIACLKSLAMPASVAVMQRGGDMARELAATDGAIGMTTAAVAEQSDGKVRVLALDGVAPSAANVANGSYRLVREVFLIVRQPASVEVRGLLAFIASADGAALIRTNGAVPKQPG